MPTYHHRTELDHTAEELFRWHTRPGAFERLMPPWADVRVLERKGGIRDGGTVLLQLRRGPARISWHLEHTGYEEGRAFRDEQLSGPFKRWIHTHRFIPVAGGSSIVENEISWDPPLGSLGRLVSSFFRQGELDRMFAYRGRRLRTDLARHRAFEEGGKRRGLTVAIAGASGMVGTALRHFLTTGGHEVRPLVRRRPARGSKEIHWNIERREIDAAALDGVDAVVHLGGESLFGLRWTERKRRAIMESRRRSTRFLSETLAGLEHRPSVFVCASAVGYYGDRGNDIMTEEAGPGRGFLAEVCREWEAAADPARRAGIRTVHLRTGLVTSGSGGALAVMLPAFKMGVAGRLGSGLQYMSWIDLDDLLGIIHKSLEDSSIEGPVNATAPHPVTNATFTDTLGRVLRRPTILPLPGLGLKTLFGEMGRELLLDGVRVLPRKMEETGFPFFFPSLEESLRHQLGRGDPWEGSER